MNFARLFPRRQRRRGAGHRPIRLMNVVPTFMCGGTENQFMTLGRSLDADRFELEFACLRKWGSLADELDARRIPLLECDISTFRSVHAVRQQIRLARHIAARSIDVVHAYSFYGNVFAIPPALLGGAPVVIASIRDRAPYLTPTQKRVQRLMCRFADCVLVNAVAVKDWLIAHGYESSKIVVIPNGVDLDRFAGAVDSQRLLAELGVPAGAPVVGVVSRLIRMKGLEQFLEAAVVVGARFPDTRFVIVGDTNPHERPYFTVLTDLARSLGLADRVVFAGLRTDVPALLASFTVAVMPSLNEALSNVLLESMAAGAPVVATRVGGTPEAVQDGVNGLLVPPGQPLALANAIGELLGNPPLAARLGEAARQSINERFSTTRMVAATEELYRSLLERRGPVAVPASTEFACK
jgi:glycosyltransferase involved in cell wall biosynthesis